MNQTIHIVCPSCNAINRVPSHRLSENPLCGSCKEMIFNSHPVELTLLNFDRHVHNTDIPVVVDFWASWCGPCKMMAPVFEQASSSMEPNVRFAKVNTETEQGLAVQFGIKSIPTMIIFRDGREMTRQSGALDLSSLIRWIQNYI